MHDLQNSKSRAELEEHGAQKDTNKYEMVYVEWLQEVAACDKTNGTQIQQQVRSEHNMHAADLKCMGMPTTAGS